ncbi:MAG TPA: LytR C-terminal domain-containing protein [Actinomycetota bacterium]|nr:LytR C-terminal domain-containing protein [Actinomycetota bacterium]
MAASTIRFAIIVALVVGGVFIINQAFGTSPGSGGTGVLPDDGGPTVTTSPSASPTETAPPTDQPSPTVAGTIIQVLNAAGVDGLAGDTTSRLVDLFDYEALEPATAPAISSTTTIYFVSRGDRIEAEFLANSRAFRRISTTIRVARLPSDQEVEEGVQLVINLGQDYAQAAP